MLIKTEIMIVHMEKAKENHGALMIIDQKKKKTKLYDLTRGY